MFMINKIYVLLCIICRALHLRLIAAHFVGFLIDVVFGHKSVLAIAWFAHHALKTSLWIQVQKSKGVLDQSFFNSIVQIGVCLETWHLVYFNQLRRQSLVNHHVEAEDLETDLVVQVVRLATAVQMVDVWLRNAHRLHYNVLNLLLHQINSFFAFFFNKQLENGLITSLRSFSVITCILLKLRCIFINSVVG